MTLTGKFLMRSLALTTAALFTLGCPMATAADGVAVIRDEVRGLVAGAAQGQSLSVNIYPRNALPGTAQRIDTVLLDGGVFRDPVDFVPGMTDITVAYGSFLKSSRVQVRIEPQELLIRLDWSASDPKAVCHLYVDEQRVFDKTQAYGSRRRLSDSGEGLYYGAALGGLYPMWVQYEQGNGPCTATVSAFLNGRQLFSRQQVLASANPLNPLAGEGLPDSNPSAWHVGTFSLSSDRTVGAWQVVDQSGAPAWIGRRAMAPQGALLNGTDVNPARIAAAVFPLTDYTLQVLDGANGSGGVTLAVGQSTIVRAYGLVDDVRKSENKAQELLGLTRLASPTSVGVLDGRGVFTALVPGTTAVIASDAKGHSRRIDITVVGDATDSDGDGLPNATEVAMGTDPNKADTDGDGINDAYEIRNQLNPVVADANEDRDGDGLTNAVEAARGTVADRLDTDGDRISDAQELLQGTDPLVGGDADGDRLADAAEVYYGTNPALADSDGDFVPDGIEVIRGTDPRRIASFPSAYDLDNDGLTTQREVWINNNLASLGYAGESPLNPSAWDSDNDLLADGYEANNGTDPTKSNRTDGGYGDTDGDGINDFDEQIYGTNPGKKDTDGDGTDDGDEIANGTDPTDPTDGASLTDSDGDGLPDRDEPGHGTDPGRSDSDGDGVNDGTEVANGSDPTDPQDFPGDGDGRSIPEEPPHYTHAELTLVVGDPSGSHSERWRLQVGSVGYVTSDFGAVETREFKTFQRGKSYPVVIQHVASNVSPPDYDWRAVISGIAGTTGWSTGDTTVYEAGSSGTTTGPMIIYDQDKEASFSLLQPGEKHGDLNNITLGKQAYVILPYARLHGQEGETSRMAQYAASLRKRSGTVSEPVIIIESGGDGSTSGCSLYGCIDNKTNTWTLRAGATGANGAARPNGYTVKWSGFPGASSADTATCTITAPGRYSPKLEVFDDKGQLVGKAEVRSLVVEQKPTELASGMPTALDESQRVGSAVQVTAPALTPQPPKPFYMDVMVGGKPGGSTRTRVSLDGYPQNEYWVTSADNGDLPQAAGIEGSYPVYVQGYNGASSAPGDAVIQVSGGWLATNNDTDTSLRQGWHELDTGITTTFQMVPSIAASGSTANLQIVGEVRIPSFTPTGDYLRFYDVDGTTDITVTKTQYDQAVQAAANGGTLPDWSERMVVVDQIYPDASGVSTGSRKLGVSVMIGYKVKLGWHDAKFTANLPAGAHRMKEALAVIRIAHETATTHVATTLKKSLSAPALTAQITGTPQVIGKQIVVGFTGEVHDAQAGLVASSSITAVHAYLGPSLIGSIPVQVVADAVSDFAPYAKHFTFSGSVTFPAWVGTQVVSLRTDSNALGVHGGMDVPVTMSGVQPVPDLAAQVTLDLGTGLTTEVAETITLTSPDSSAGGALITVALTETAASSRTFTNAAGWSVTVGDPQGDTLFVAVDLHDEPRFMGDFTHTTGGRYERTDAWAPTITGPTIVAYQVSWNASGTATIAMPAIFGAGAPVPLAGSPGSWSGTFNGNTVGVVVASVTDHTQVPVVTTSQVQISINGQSVATMPGSDPTAAGGAAASYTISDPAEVASYALETVGAGRSANLGTSASAWEPYRVRVDIPEAVKDAVLKDRTWTIQGRPAILAQDANDPTHFYVQDPQTGKPAVFIDPAVAATTDPRSTDAVGDGSGAVAGDPPVPTGVAIYVGDQGGVQVVIVKAAGKSPPATLPPLRVIFRDGMHLPPQVFPPQPDAQVTVHGYPTQGSEVADIVCTLQTSLVSAATLVGEAQGDFSQTIISGYLATFAQDVPAWTWTQGEGSDAPAGWVWAGGEGQAMVGAPAFWTLPSEDGASGNHVMVTDAVAKALGEPGIPLPTADFASEKKRIVLSHLAAMVGKGSINHWDEATAQRVYAWMLANLFEPPKPGQIEPQFRPRYTTLRALDPSKLIAAFNAEIAEMAQANAKTYEGRQYGTWVLPTEELATPMPWQTAIESVSNLADPFGAAVMLSAGEPLIAKAEGATWTGVVRATGWLLLDRIPGVGAARKAKLVARRVAANAREVLPVRKLAREELVIAGKKVKNIKMRKAEDVNLELLNSPNSLKKPYADGTEVSEFELEQEVTFIRYVYTKDPRGKWLSTESDTLGMSAPEVHKSLCMPEVPKEVYLVRVPAGTKMRKGRVGKQDGANGTNNWGHPLDGGMQYELTSFIPGENFTFYKAFP